MNKPNTTTPQPLDLAQFEGFTPGPWHLTWNDDRPNAIRPDMVAQVNGIGVACTLAMSGMDHEANGQLIAAAPQLLAALHQSREREARLVAALALLLDHPEGGCYCDNGHAQNETVCGDCYARAALRDSQGVERE